MWIQTNITLEQNLKFITKGLKFVGRFGYDTYNNNHINRRKIEKRAMECRTFTR